MLNSRYRLLYGALIVATGFITALLFRKPFDTGPSASVSSRTSSFTELGPAAPIASTTLPVQPFEKPALSNDQKTSSSLSNSRNPFERYSAADAQSSSNQKGDLEEEIGKHKNHEIPKLADRFPTSDNDWGRSDESHVTKVAPFNAESQSSTAQNNFATTLSNSAFTALKPIEPTPSSSAPVATAIKPSQNFTASTAVPWPQLPNDPLNAVIPPVPSPVNQFNQATQQQDDLVHWSPNRPGLDQPRADSLAPKVTSSQDPFQRANSTNVAPSSNNSAAIPPLATYSPQSNSSQPNLSAAPNTLANSSIFPSTQSAPLAPAAVPGSNMMRHVIQDGDTLQLLAQHYYGDARRAEELFVINRDTLRNPELLPLGATLQIPGSITSQPFIAPVTANFQTGSALTPGYQAPIPQTTPPNSPSALPNSANDPRPFIRPISTALQPPPVDSIARQNIAPPTIYSSNYPDQSPNSREINAPHPNINSPLTPIGQSSSATNNPAQNQPPHFGAQPSNQLPGWPPQNTANQNLAGWPPNSARASSGSSFTNGMKSFGENVWQGSTSAMNWVGNTVLGSSTTAPTSTEKTYIVRAGDSWETLANRFYGDKAQAMKLLQANSNRLNGMIALRPGMVIEVPPK